MGNRIIVKNLMPDNYFNADPEFKDDLLKAVFEGVMKTVKSYIPLVERRIPAIIIMIDATIKELEKQEMYEECQFYLDLRQYAASVEINKEDTNQNEL